MADDWWDEDDFIDKPADGSEDEYYGGGGSDGFLWWQRDLPPRFWMPAESEREVVFLDEEFFPIFEHEFTINGNRGGFATCVKSMPNRTCHLCEAGCPSYKIRFCSVINITGWTDSKGEEHKNVPSLLPAKERTCKLLRKKYKRKEGLKHWKYIVYRSSKQVSRIGDDWSEPEKIDGVTTEPFDYKEILKPFSDEELKRIAGLASWRGKTAGVSSGAGNYSSGDVDYEDDGSVPF